jgi:hypothetical protein
VSDQSSIWNNHRFETGEDEQLSLDGLSSDLHLRVSGSENEGDFDTENLPAWAEFSDSVSLDDSEGLEDWESVAFASSGILGSDSEPILDAVSDSDASRFASTEARGTVGHQAPTTDDPVADTLNRRRFSLAIGSSVTLHAALLITLIFLDALKPFDSSLPDESRERANTVVIRLLPENPLRSEAQVTENPPLETQEQVVAEARSAEAETELQPELVAETETDVVSDSMEELQLEQTARTTPDTTLDITPDTAPDTTPDTAPETTQTQANESLVTIPALDVPQRTLEQESSERRDSSSLVPSIATMQRSIQQMNEQRQASGWGKQCNPLEQEAELLECGAGEQRDYARALTNTTYLSLNPTFTQTREQRSISTIALQRETLLAQLDSADIPQWQRDYAAQQLEISLSDESNFGRQTVNQIIQMTDKSEAGRQARMMFGDAWLLNTVREAVERNVHSEQIPYGLDKK